MRRLVDLVKLDRLDALVRRQATGSPEQLSRRLDMSRSTLFEFIAFLRDEMGAPIRYSKSRNSYMYEYVPRFCLGFEKERMQPAELYGACGGIDDDVCDEEPDESVIPDDINFNDLYMDDYY
ncbi:MAG: hypothetical protein LBS42_10425, partial [Tannerella sp.]|jgi:biotin operon repressor|nr:hypothetical protein [Tannerella sp.]